MHGVVMQNLLRTVNMGFFHFPHVNGKPWPEDVQHQFAKHVSKTIPEPWLDYIYVKVRGTVVSGLATRTTLGNTLRSLMFVYFYLWDAGISETPWNDPRIFVIASGDDVVVFVLKCIAR